MRLFAKNHKPASGSSQITIISEHLSVSGEINGTDHVYINGSFKGRIVTTGQVSIGPKGKVAAEIETKSLLVSGYLEGNIQCEAMTIFPSGQVIGKLCSSTLKLHPGGYYFGESTLRKIQPAQADASKTVPSVVLALPLLKVTSNAPAIESTSDKLNLATSIKAAAGKY